MSQFKETADSRQVSEDTSDLSEGVGVRTRGQKKVDERRAKLKKRLTVLQKKAERFVGGKIETNERGLGARSAHSDKNELWKYHCRWSDKWWDEEVAKKVKKLMKNHEKGCHSAVESDHREVWFLCSQQA